MRGEEGEEEEEASKRTSGSLVCESATAATTAAYPQQKTAATMSHEDKFIPERKKLDQLSVVKDYSAIPRLEYR